MTVLSLFVWLVNFANLFKRNEESSAMNQAAINRLACSVFEDKNLNALKFGMAVLQFSDADEEGEKLNGSDDDQSVALKRYNSGFQAMLASIT